MTAAASFCPETGSSPRGRGTRSGAGGNGAKGRIIPAWAGNTAPRSADPPRRPDHPRVGGEHPDTARYGLLRGGSSPRGRGTRPPAPHGSGIPRIIPAWAGNTALSGTPSAPGSDHPRVGGEHPIDPEESRASNGSSPRGRGTRVLSWPVPVEARIIPAWAGNTHAAIHRGELVPDHPRVGGEHQRIDCRFSRFVGSSPRGRGTPANRLSVQPFRRIIPAWAGNTNGRGPPSKTPTDHPRVGGEHTRMQALSPRQIGSSPRGRGTRRCRSSATAPHRIIPAWAGNTLPSGRAPVPGTDHPRVGGEHVRAALDRVLRFGSSPRGRGTHQYA